MIAELLAGAGGTFLVVSAAVDLVVDGPADAAARFDAAVQRLADRIGRRIHVARSRNEIDDWLTAEGGSADIDPETREFLELQLKLIYKEMNNR